MNTILNIGIAVISPALIISVMIFMINSVNKRIDDLRSEMKSDHAKLANAVGDLSSVVLGFLLTFQRSQMREETKHKNPK